MQLKAMQSSNMSRIPLRLKLTLPIQTPLWAFDCKCNQPAHTVLKFTVTEVYN